MDAFPIGGWLLLPRDKVVGRSLVVGHGYGGRDQPDFDLSVQETAVLFPCFRGLSWSSLGGIPGDPYSHVLHDIDRPERYILGGCVEDLWLAVSALRALFPGIDGRIGYVGTSFGGGIGALATAFDPRIDRGCLEAPTFGNMPLWLTLPTVGSGNSEQNHLKTHRQALETLRLFDAATAATRIEAPVLVAVARFDPAVAPPCQFSVAHARLTSIPRAPPSEHGPEPTRRERPHAIADRFAASRLSAMALNLAPSSGLACIRRWKSTRRSTSSRQ